MNNDGNSILNSVEFNFQFNTWRKPDTTLSTWPVIGNIEINIDATWETLTSNPQEFAINPLSPLGYREYEFRASNAETYLITDAGIYDNFVDIRAYSTSGGSWSNVDTEELEYDYFAGDFIYTPVFSGGFVYLHFPDFPAGGTNIVSDNYCMADALSLIHI